MRREDFGTVTLEIPIEHIEDTKWMIWDIIYSACLYFRAHCFKERGAKEEIRVYFKIM